MQRDIIAIYDRAGTKLVSYTYDAWGNMTVTYHNSGDRSTAVNNSLTYRGYYYDKDLGLYYLVSRYYDPNVCRFINADAYVSTGQGILGNNMYAYCGNNPVMYADYTGEWTFSINLSLFGGFITGYIFNAGVSVDSEGKIAFQWSNPFDSQANSARKNIVYGASASAGVVMQYTNLDSVNDLTGDITSKGVNTPFGSFDVIVDENDDYAGFSVGTGPSIGGDYHESKTPTATIGEAFDSVIEIVKGWLGFD